MAGTRAIDHPERLLRGIMRPLRRTPSHSGPRRARPCVTSSSPPPRSRGEESGGPSGTGPSPVRSLRRGRSSRRARDSARGDSESVRVTPVIHRAFATLSRGESALSDIERERPCARAQAPSAPLRRPRPATPPPPPPRYRVGGGSARADVAARVEERGIQVGSLARSDFGGGGWSWVGRRGCVEARGAGGREGGESKKPPSGEKGENGGPDLAARRANERKTAGGVENAAEDGRGVEVLR